MKASRLLGALAVLLILGAIGVILASFVTSNDLLTDSEVRGAAAASAGAFLVAILVFIGVGRPWRAWKRTPYW